VFERDTFGFMLVFGLSSRCNLECVYCNANAGPRGARAVLDIRIVEKWIDAFASLGPSLMAIQLHGGEPLLVDPPVELYAAVARNVLAQYPRTKLDYLGVQSNGSALDERRAGSLAGVGLQIDLSIDGPASIHDRHRSMPGRSNHREVVRAHRLLRARGRNAGVIAVACDPHDVVPAVEFFLEGGFRDVRMNILRPEGRGRVMVAWEDAGFMRAMAREYFRAALLIAEHNRRRPEAPFYEFNLGSLMQILIGEAPRSEMMYWSFLIDDRGRLWSHPCGFYAARSVRLTENEPPSRELLRRILALESSGTPAEVATSIRERLTESSFGACAECKSPDFCVPVYGRQHTGGSRNPVCVWTTDLITHLAKWLRDDPEAARRIVPLPGRPRIDETAVGAAAV
jgi:MoaA/NifB/PqqE/SkfB family radical SAM enzyme